MSQHLVQATGRHLRVVGGRADHSADHSTDRPVAAGSSAFGLAGHGDAAPRTTPLASRVVAHVVSSLADDAYESVIAPLAARAPGLGLSLVVIELTGERGPLAAGRLARLTEQGAQVHSLGIGRFSLRSAARLAGLLRRLGVQVAHTHGRQADVIGGLAAREAGIPAVSTLHDANFEALGAGTALRMLAGRGAHRRFHERVLVASQTELTRYAERTGATNLVLTPQWAADVNPTLSREQVRADLGVDPRTLLLLAVAPLRADQGLVDLLGAVARLPRHLRVALVVVGDGPMRDLLRDDVSLTPSLCDRVTFVGARTDIDDLIGAADIVVDPALDGDLPPVVLAALAAGRPVVATDVGSTGLAVTPGVGALVPTSDPTALAVALMTLIEDAGLRAASGRRARRRFESTFALDAWAAGLSATYADLVAG